LREAGLGCAACPSAIRPNSSMHFGAKLWSSWDTRPLAHMRRLSHPGPLMPCRMVWSDRPAIGRAVALTSSTELGRGRPLASLGSVGASQVERKPDPGRRCVRMRRNGGWPVSRVAIVLRQLLPASGKVRSPGMVAPIDWVTRRSGTNGPHRYDAHRVQPGRISTDERGPDGGRSWPAEEAPTEK